MSRTMDSSAGSRVLNFTTIDFNGGINLKMDHVLDFVMSLNIKLLPNSSFNIILQNREKKDVYNLFYVSSDIHITAQVTTLIFFLQHGA